MSEIEPVLALAEELCRIDSVIGQEAEIADWIEVRLRAAGMAEVVRAGNSIAVRPCIPDPARSNLLLIGHVDTVPASGPNPVRREADRLYGLGASDMKAACALILTLLERNIEQVATHNLVGILYAREEGPYVESEMPLIHAAVSSWFAGSDLAICMEPTDNRIELGCLGTSHAKVTFAGKRAHSARPWQGDNAIHKAAAFLTRLRDFGKRVHGFHDLEFFEVMSATMVNFSGARNVIPDRFEVNLNYRFAPGREEPDVCQEIEAVVAGEAEWELVDYCPAGKVCGDNPLLAELKQVAGPVEVCAKQAWTDVGRLSHMGLDAINFGPGATSQAHQQGEWVSVQAIAWSVGVMSRWLRLPA